MLVQVNKWQSEKDYVLHHNQMFVWASQEDGTAFQLECLGGLVKRVVQHSN